MFGVRKKNDEFLVHLDSVNTAEEMPTDSNSSDDDDSTYDGEDSSYEEDPELMQYYFALQDSNVCSCCLPSLFIDTLEG